MILVDAGVPYYGICMRRLTLIQLATTAAIFSPFFILGEDPATGETVVVYREPGRYGGWSANQGMIVRGTRTEASKAPSGRLPALFNFHLHHAPTHL